MKSYAINFKNGRVLKLSGNIVLFNSNTQSLKPVEDAIYLNSEDVSSIIEINLNAKEAK